MVIAAAGILTFLGWAIGKPPLILSLRGSAIMSPVAALGFALAGLALCCRTCGTVGRPAGRGLCASGLASLIVFLGAFKVADYLFGLRFHIDELFFARKLMPYSGTLPTALAPNSALALLLIGAGLLLFELQTSRGGIPSQMFFLVSGLIGIVALLGYTYGVAALYQWGQMPQMSMAGAAAAFVFSMGALAGRPERGLTTVLISRTTGGAVARRLLPMALIVPWVLGVLLLSGEQGGYFQWEFTVAIFAASSLVVFTILIWWNAELLHRADLEELRTTRRMAAQHQATGVLAESATLPQALPKVLEIIGEALECEVGAAWKLDAQLNAFRCIEIWRHPNGDAESFIQATRSTLLPRGTGLPGKTWAGARPIWLPDAGNEKDLPRAQAAAESGLHSAFSFPLWQGSALFGTMEFFSRRRIQAPEQGLLEMLANLGSQLGLFIKRTQAEEQLRHASANLQRSNTELQQFAYVASHDLFEPLRMISSYLQLLSQKYEPQLPGEAREFISLAVDGAKRMDALIRDLLAYSRVDAHGREFAPVDLEEAFRAATANLKVAIQETGASITHQPLPRVLADEVQMSQLFQNLIGNAIKFHGAESPRIEVGMQRREHDWLFHIKDNGIGIEPRYVERIFVIFQRLHTRQEYAGTGMGLAICKKIVERHGGRIWVESAPGRGSTFFFSLPVLDEQGVAS